MSPAKSMIERSEDVFVKEKDTPQRVHEYLSRAVTTVEWDKKRTARTLILPKIRIDS